LVEKLPKHYYLANQDVEYGTNGQRPWGVALAKNCGRGPVQSNL